MSVDSIASIAVAIGTVFLALVALAQVRVSQRQVSTSQQSLAATERAISATQRAAEETARGRVDANTFRVVPEFSEPEWPPLLNPSLNKMPGGGDPTLLDPVNVHGSWEVTHDHVFSFPREENQLLWFKVCGLLRNEGSGTAFIALPRTCRVKADSGPYAGTPNLRVHDRVTGHYQPRHVLEPGEAMAIEWAAGRPLKEWADAYENPNPPNPMGALFLELIARDTFKEGVIDNIYITMQGKPLEPSPAEQGRWRLRRERSMVSAEYPSVRRRRGLDAQDIRPPWSEKFDFSNGSAS